MRKFYCTTEYWIAQKLIFFIGFLAYTLKISVSQCNICITGVFFCYALSRTIFKLHRGLDSFGFKSSEFWLFISTVISLLFSYFKFGLNTDVFLLLLVVDYFIYSISRGFVKSRPGKNTLLIR